jgi:hypothetical protein
MSVKRNPRLSALFLLIPTSSVEGRDTCMDLENFYVTHCFSHDYHLKLVNTLNQNTQSVYTTREKETDNDTFFFKKRFPTKKIEKKIKKMS